MSKSFEKAVEAASEAIAGRHWRTAMDDARAALRAALPHLTAQDVPHLIRQAKAEAWEAFCRDAATVGYLGRANAQKLIESNPYAEEAT